MPGESKLLKGDRDGLSEEEKGFEEEDDNSCSDLMGVEGRGYDETKELFRNSEQYPAGDGGMEAEEERGGEESNDGLNDDFSFTPIQDVGGFSASSEKESQSFQSKCVHVLYHLRMCM